MLDYIIVGQGIAGSMLSWFLLQENQKTLLVDKLRLSSASRVASGISNPITGRRFVKTWMVDELFPFAEKTYQGFEVLFKQKFFHQIPIVKLFDSIKAQNDWSARCASEEYLPYLKNDQIIHLDSNKVKNDFGGFEINGGTQLEVTSFLNAFRTFLREKECIREEEFSVHEMMVEKDFVSWKGVKARNIIFCEGAFAADNPYFKFFPFQLAKGERLKVRIPDFYPDRVINGEVFILPEKQADEYYIGATHDWYFDDALPSEKGKQELLANLQSFLKAPFEVLAHESAIRPTVKDRRPFIGLHPESPRLGIFNGMGTKGISLAPFFAKHFTDHLLHGTPLMPEVDIHRFL